MICFVVQARSGSTRMPNKVYLPFYNGKSILDLLIDKLKQVDGTKVIIATSTNSNCDPIEKVAQSHNVTCFRGSENDVLQRFIDAAEANKAVKIIRVCSDNPFLDLSSVKKLVNEAQKTDGIDYMSFNVDGTPSIKTHYGFWTEFVTLEALKRIKVLTNEALYHEHVTNYIYAHPESFYIKWIDGPKIITCHKDIRLTIDTEEDFRNAQAIYADLCYDNPYPTIEDVVNYLECHQEYYKLMRMQIVRNSK